MLNEQELGQKRVEWCIETHEDKIASLVGDELSEFLNQNSNVIADNTVLSVEDIKVLDQRLHGCIVPNDVYLESVHPGYGEALTSNHEVQKITGDINYDQNYNLTGRALKGFGWLYQQRGLFDLGQSCINYGIHLILRHSIERITCGTSGSQSQNVSSGNTTSGSGRGKKSQNCSSSFRRH